MRSAGERVLDPAFGGGVFLDAAARRSAELDGGATAAGVFGVELDPQAHATTCGLFGDTLDRRRLLQADFFSLDAEALPRMHAVVGNPPFIRFQRFGGAGRKLAARRSRDCGVPLAPLAGSWVAFVAHATSFLAPGGRLGMVVPAELGHAPYARPLLALLLDSFSRCTLVTFRDSLFPHLDQRTVLLLADGYRRGPGEFTALDLAGPEALKRPLPCAGDTPLDGQALLSGRSSLAHLQLEAATRSLYRELPSRGAVRLGDAAKVESGYVTGANRYFHLGPEAVREAGLPDEVLVPTVFRARALTGLAFGPDDWLAATDDATAGYLVQAYGHEEVPSVAAFLGRLTQDRVHLRYKTRHRAVWHRVPRVTAPPLLLAAMGGRGLRMTVNEAGVAAPNTFHLVTPSPSTSSSTPHGGLHPLSLVAAWLTSLAALSVELEGHALGGGMLKLDPGEARGVLLPPPVPMSAACLERIDRLLRCGERKAARHEADRLLLHRALGLSGNEIDRLASAAEELATRRQSRVERVVEAEP